MTNAARGLEPDALSFGPFCLYPRQRRLERDRRGVRIGDRALDILLLLVERAGEVVAQDELIASVWKEVAVAESALRVHIAGLRKALGDVDGSQYVRNVMGRGYSFVEVVSRPIATEHVEPRLAPALARPSRLPHRLTRMIGRDEVVGDVLALLSSEHFVSIVGPGGIGKTTVAIAVAHAMFRELAGDVCFVDLNSVTDSAQVPVSIASALGFAAGADQVADGLAAFLRDRTVLIVFDSCEHVINAVAPLAERISRDASGARILATTREPLRFEGERVYRMPPLETPPEADGLSASEALSFPAVQLFVERATAQGARLTLSDADAPVVAHICRRLDGVALAIEVAAGRVGAYGIRGTASLLENRLRLLWHGRRTALPRHQTLSALLDWSHNLLGEAERIVLRRLSLFVGRFSLDAAAAIAGELDPEAAVDALGSLVDKSLVALVETGDSGASYRLLDTTRAYARAKLDASGERDRVAALQATYFCELLEQESHTRSGVLERSTADQLGNIRSSLEWAFSTAGDARLATRLAAAAAPLFMELSLLPEVRRLVAATYEKSS